MSEHDISVDFSIVFVHVGNDACVYGLSTTYITLSLYLIGKSLWTNLLAHNNAGTYKSDKQASLSLYRCGESKRLYRLESLSKHWYAQAHSLSLKRVRIVLNRAIISVRFIHYDSLFL